MNKEYREKYLNLCLSSCLQTLAHISTSKRAFKSGTATSFLIKPRYLMLMPDRCTIINILDSCMHPKLQPQLTSPSYHLFLLPLIPFPPLPTFFFFLSLTTPNSPPLSLLLISPLFFPSLMSFPLCLRSSSSLPFFTYHQQI
jgi:hypothetical protein